VPDPAPKPKPKGLVNQRQVRAASEILTLAAKQIQDGFQALGQEAFLGRPVLFMTGGHLSYDIKVTIQDSEDEKDKGKESTVKIDLDIGVVTPQQGFEAAYAMLSGPIAPAEARRPEIESLLRSKGLLEERPVILGITRNKYWVHQPDGPHVVVEFRDTGEGSLKVVKTLEELNREVDGFFSFLSDKVGVIYGG